jgi:AcrR family transcriptional regulator
MRLIAEEGSSVSMETVASAADISRATLYRYYTSREHLLAEVTLAAGRTMISFLRANPSRGTTVGEQVEALCRTVTAVAGENEQLLASCVSNLSSEDPAVLETYREIEELVSGMLGSVIDGLAPANGSMIQTTVFRYLLGSFVLATTGKLEYAEVAENLTALCRLLLADVWSEKARPSSG